MPSFRCLGFALRIVGVLQLTEIALLESRTASRQSCAENWCWLPTGLCEFPGLPDEQELRRVEDGMREVGPHNRIV